MSKKKPASAIQPAEKPHEVRVLHPVEIAPAPSLPDATETTLAARLRAFMERFTETDRLALLADPRLKDRDRYLLNMITDAIKGNDSTRREILARLDGKYPTIAVEVRPEYSIAEFHRESDRALIEQLRNENAELKASLNRKELTGDAA